MGKVLLKFVAAAAAAVFCVNGVAAANTVFSEDFATEDAFNKWSVVDANNDGKSFKFEASDSRPSNVFYGYSAANDADDWLISPAIKIEKAGSYVVRYEFSGSSYKEELDVWCGDARSVEGMKTKKAEHRNIVDKKEGGYFLLDLKAGDFFIGFHAVTPKNRYNLYVCNVVVEEVSNPVDLRVSEIISPVEGEGLASETVKVRVQNDGLVDVDNFAVAYSIDGGEAVKEDVAKALKAGESYEHTFKTPADLSISRHNYMVKAWTEHADDVLTANDATEVTVKHIGPAQVPYSMGFELDEDISMFKFVNNNNDDGEWSRYTNGFWDKYSRTGDCCLAYNYDSNNNADDWCILEPVSMEAGYHVLKFWYSATDGHPERMKVCYGTSQDPAAMTNVLIELDPVVNSKYQEAIAIFNVAEAGNIYIGFYCFSNKNENWLLVDDLTIDRISDTSLDLIAGDISSPVEYLRGANSRDLEFELRNVGIISADATVNVYVDGAKATSFAVTVAGQEIKKVSKPGVFAGLAEGSHAVKVEVVCDKDNNAANNVVEKTVVVLGSPVAHWDFEDQKLPGEFTFRVEDIGVVHPDAGAEFNEDGFGLFKVSHALLGKYALATATWFTEDDVRADRYIVMPKVRVTGENAYFAWNANSYNPSFPEKYEVKVSDKEDKWSNYDTELAVDREPEFVQSRGIDLGKYKDKDVYVAINVKSLPGEALLLDNLGFYGDVELLTSGISTVKPGDGVCPMWIDGDMIRTDGTVEAIEVYDVRGVRVAAGGEGVDVSSLERGVYIARGTTASGPVQIKFAK